MIQDSFTMPQINMFGGDSDSLIFTIKRPSNRPIDVSTMSFKFALIDYTNKFGLPLFVKTGVAIFNDTTKLKSDFRVMLDVSDTINLFGKYIYQISIADIDGDIKSLQGIIIVNKNINEAGVIAQSHV